MSRNRLSRRKFLAATAAAVFPTFIPASALGKDGHVAPSERIVVGQIGLGGQGARDMNAFLRIPEVQVVALCDVDAGSANYENQWHRGLAPAMDAVTKHYTDEKRASDCQGYNDFRELLAREDIDAVGVGTPDHWHALMVVAAAKAGKDIYCQKPLARTIPEGRAMVRAIRENKRVFQCGSQRRSEAQCRRSCEAVRNKLIGKLQRVEVRLPGGHSNPGYQMGNDPMPVPDGFDYDKWLGPAPDAPYTHKRCHFTFRWNLDYSGGQMTDWGAHFVDMAHWGMGVGGVGDAEQGPVEIEGAGTFPPRENLWNTATEFKLRYRYASGVELTLESGAHGVTFIGDQGRVGLDAKVQRDDGEVVRPTRSNCPIQLYESRHHYRDFVHAVKERRDPAAPIDVAHTSIAPSHLGNIAMMLGRTLHWDPVAERFQGDDVANAMLQRTYREPWTLENFV